MADDVLITPASRKIEFKDTSGNVDAKIETDASGNLLITNPGGDISIGDTTSDVYIGDGINNIDIVFEQSGEIRGLTGVTVTLGQSDSFIVMGTDLNLNNKNIINVASIGANTVSFGTHSDASSNTVTVATTSLTSLDTSAAATYRTIKYVVQITQGSSYQSSEVLITHNGTTAYMTEYGIIRTGSNLGTLSTDISGGNVRLLVTMASATSATIKIQKTTIDV